MPELTKVKGEDTRSQRVPVEAEREIDRHDFDHRNNRLEQERPPQIRSRRSASDHQASAVDVEDPELLYGLGVVAVERVLFAFGYVDGRDPAREVAVDASGEVEIGVAGQCLGGSVVVWHP